MRPSSLLYTQQQIVAEIEAEQALVAANRELITRFKQKIQATLARIWHSSRWGQAVTCYFSLIFAEVRPGCDRGQGMRSEGINEIFFSLGVP